MKKLVFLFTLSLTQLFAQTDQSASWNAEYSKSKSFVENIGQFDQNETSTTGKIRYAIDFGATRIFFGEKGVSYSFLEATKIPKEQRDELRIKMAQYPAERKKYEKLIGKFLFKNDLINMKWENASASAQLIGEDETIDYHNYSYNKSNGEMVGASGAKGYGKLLYKNLYPNIDVEYVVHPEIGIKYAVIVHPGADPSMVKMAYDRDISLLEGKIQIPTQFGNIIDHEPYSFYENDREHLINSNFKQEQRSISFEVGNYDNTKTLIIDPWTQTPAFASNWDVVWECDKDAAGNVYILGGIMPMQVLKYNSTGSLLWTYNTPYDTSNVWLGTFAVDNAGNSYVTAGSAAQIQKISTAGALVWNNASPGGLLALTEFWNIAFNCDQTKLVVGGTDGPALGGPIPYVFDINMSSGNVISSAQVTGGGSLIGFPPNTPEVRAIIATKNNKYYFMTHDSIGYISDNLTNCPGQLGNFRVNSGYGMSYKCEDFRYDNAGIEAIGYYNSFVFVNRGNRLDKRDFNTGSILQSVTIPGGGWTTSFGQNVTQNSGISIDDCGNIYVGSKTGVYKFNQSLVQTDFYATSFSVYDVEVNTNGEIIACGGTGTGTSTNRSGGVQTFSAAACAPQTTTCCDASVCSPGELCSSDAPVTLTPGTAGGTWSGTGVNASGVFNPATAGPGTHAITYTLSCGSETISIIVNPCLTLDVCLESNGNLTVSGGTAPYTWANFQTTTTTSNDCVTCGGTAVPFIGCVGATLPCTITANGYVNFGTGATVTPPSGATSIQVTDNAGTVYTFDPSTAVACGSDPCSGVTISVNTTPTNVSCFGGSNGAITASASGATGAFTYSWSPSGSGATISNLTAGTYSVTATSSAGCTGTATQTISQPASALTVSANATATNCGVSTGTATATAAGGTSGYSYAWSPSGGNAATVSNLAAGNYTVTVTDQNSCTATATASVTTNGGPSITVSSSSNPSCNGGNNGTATVSGSGGSGSLTYSWSPGGLSGATQNNLTAGSYTVTVTDGGGCSNTVSVNITEPTAITVTQGTITPASCGANDGAAAVNASGGTGTLTYAWSPSGGNSSSATNIPGGSYTVTVTDQNSCTSTIGIVVSTIGGPSVTVQSQTNVSCFGLSDGSATISATGGSAPYTYNWTPSGGANSTASNLAAGVYNVAVTDQSGCVGAVTVTITEPTQIVLSPNVTASDCGASNGAINLTISGGASPYATNWIGPNAFVSGSEDISNLAAGTYTLTVTDANGCTETENLNVITIGSLNITATPTVQTINEGDSVAISVSGGTTYSWNPSTDLSCGNCSNPVASPSQTTIYTVTGTDASGCTGTADVTIIVNEICGDLYVPTVFAPNASTGSAENTQLCIYGNCISSLSYAIYDRWGAKVFETTSTSICWDGTYKGKELNAGVFAYKLIVTLNNGDYKEESGNVTLIR
jgi:gliding motility-associated-like protein